MGDSFLKLQEICNFRQNVCIEVYEILSTGFTDTNDKTLDVFFHGSG